MKNANSVIFFGPALLFVLPIYLVNVVIGEQNLLAKKE
jgi:hypothetical protein